MPQINLIVKPSSSNCNLKCVYCQFNDNLSENHGFMSEQTLETLVRKMLLYAEGKLEIFFCGGEPSLVGLDFYKTFVRFMKLFNQNKVKASYVFRTNAVLLNDEWADFFKQNNFTVQVSLDGYKETNDLSRFDANGYGSFGNVMKSLELLKKRDIYFEIITVVNNITARHIKKIYAFYKKNGFKNLIFVPCLEINDRRGKNHYSLTPEIYAQFLRELFDLWHIDLIANNNVSIKHFDNYVAMMYGFPADICFINAVCPEQFIIEADGSVFPCLRLVSDDYYIGNITEQAADFKSLGETAAGHGFFGQFARTQIPSECNSCKFFKLCRGGCRLDRGLGTPDETQINYYCKAYKIFFDYSYARLYKIARYLNSGRIL